MSKILVDSRAGSRDLVDLTPLRGISQLSVLASGDRQLGDVMVYGSRDDGSPLRTAVEVKSPSDFISCLPRNTGRIASQVVDVLGHDGEEPLAEEYFICVYGTWSRGEDGALLVPPGDSPYPGRIRANGLTPYRTARNRPPVRYSEVESALLTLSRAGAQRAPHLATKLDVAHWIALLAAHVKRPPCRHQTLRTLPRRGWRSFLPAATDDTTRRLMGVLSELLTDGGIGESTARALAGKFGSVHDLLTAEVDDFLIPRLVGGTKARRLFDSIRQRKR